VHVAEYHPANFGSCKHFYNDQSEVFTNFIPVKSKFFVKFVAFSSIWLASRLIHGGMSQASKKKVTDCVLNRTDSKLKLIDQRQ
jgi:hypothetical protein